MSSLQKTNGNYNLIVYLVPGRWAHYRIQNRESGKIILDYFIPWVTSTFASETPSAIDGTEWYGSEFMRHNGKRFL